MRKLLSLLLVISVVIASGSKLTSVVYAAEPVQFFVAVDGDDSQNGTIEFPFRTFNRAKQAVIDYKRNHCGIPAGGIEVIFRGGTYSLGSDGYEITNSAGGRDNIYVTYKAYDGEDVYFDGSYELDNSRFELVTDEDLLSRIPEELHGKIYEATLEELGINVDPTSMIPNYVGGGKAWKPTIELTYNNETMTAARYPNEGYTNYGNVIELGEVGEGDDFLGGTNSVSGKTVFAIDSEKAEQWKNAGEFYVAGSWGFDWYQHTIKIDEVDPQTAALTTNSYFKYGISDSQRCYFYNLLEELDAVGEYYVDVKNKKLYIFTNGVIDTVKLGCSNLSKPAVHINAANYVRIQGITIQNCAGDGIYASDTNPNEYELLGPEVINCTIRNVGGTGAKFYNARDALVTDCTIYNVGAWGVYMIPSDYREKQHWDTLESMGGRVTNNEIFYFSRYAKSYVPAVEAWTMKAEILNNTIYHTPHTAIMIGSASRIGYNELYDCCTDVQDAGVMYAGRTWIAQGTIDHNYIHNKEQKNAPLTQGIYLDDSLAGYTMKHNIFEKLTKSAAFSAINWFENNLVIGKTDSNYAAGVAVDWRFAAQKNIDAIQSTIDEFKPIFNNVWKQERPWLFEALDENYNIKEKYYKPHATVKNNIFMQAAPLNFANEVYDNSVILNNYETKTVLNFADYENGDLSLTKEAVSNYQGYEPIDFYNIGVQPSEYNPKTLIERRLTDHVVLEVNNSNALVDNKKVKIDESDDNVVPVIVDSRTFVPIRFIAECFGAEVEWDEEERIVKIISDNKTVQMPVESSVYTLNGTSLTLDVPAQIINGRVMVPLRTVSESLDKSVFWDDDGLIIIGEKAVFWDSETDNFRISQIYKSLK